MNKIIFILITSIFLNNCSFNENSRIWQDKENKLESDIKIKKIGAKDKKIVSEFNQGFELDLSFIKKSSKIVDNQNNFGSQNYKGDLNKIGNFKFSKLDEVNQLDFKPIFLKDGVIFFDKKGSIIEIIIIKRFI